MLIVYQSYFIQSFLKIFFWKRHMLKLHFLCSIWVRGIMSKIYFFNLKITSLFVQSLVRRPVQKDTVLVQTAN